jgi:hypothetical protein
MRTCVYGMWVVASVALAACGGGGGGGGTSADMSAALSSANYVDVSTQAVAATFALANNAELVTGAQVSNTNHLVQFSKAQLPKMRGWFASAPEMLTGASQSLTENCNGGGTISVVVTDVNGNDQPDAGDSATLTINHCAVDGSSVNGQLIMAVNSSSGDLDTYPHAYSATLTLNNLSTTSSQVSTVANGNFTLAVDRQSSILQTVMLTASSLTTSSTFDGATYSATLTNYQITETMGFTSSTTSVSGTVGTSLLGANTLTAATLVPFTRFYTDVYPSSGQVMVTASQGGKVRITVLSSSMLRIELDANGDGSYEASTTQLWSDMV